VVRAVDHVRQRTVDARRRLDNLEIRELRHALRGRIRLGEDARVGQLSAGARGIVFNDLPVDAPKRRVQQPSLFDFNREDSPVILRRIDA